MSLNKRNVKKGTLDYNKMNFTREKEEMGTIQYNSFGQLISRARLEKKPLVVVEGKDDVPIYEQFAKKINKKIVVRAIETFPDYSEGCVHVKRFIEDAQPVINNSEENEKYILGIIDRDASYYRKEISELKCLFVLKDYSYESHFVTRENVRFALENYLSSNYGINEKVIEFILEDYNKALNDFYYYSLEALKNACCKNYNADVGFGQSYGQIIRDENLPNKIKAKKVELDRFAELMKVPSDNKTSIIKGKWLLDLFVEKTHSSISKLSEMCMSDDLINGQEQCFFCESGNTDKCSWKPKKGYPKNMYRSFILQFFNDKEVNYIYEKLESLG